MPRILLSLAAALMISLGACTLPRGSGETGAAGAPVLPSRLTQTDAQGFYLQPAGLAEDYPDESGVRDRMVRDLERLKSLGSHILRVGIAWDGIESKPGDYEWGRWDTLFELAPKYGVTVLPYLCYTPRWLGGSGDDYWRHPPADPKRFGEFAGAIARRYRGRVASWELWNEPDNRDYWTGSATQFADLVIEGAKAVRAADPRARIVLGGMAKGDSPFLHELLARRDLVDLIDVINIHGYLGTWYPGQAQDYSWWIGNVSTRLDLWLAEFGYSSANVGEPDLPGGAGHSPAAQARELWRGHVMALASGKVSLTAWYRIHDLKPGTNVIGDASNLHLGILDVNEKPKPAYFAFKLYEKLLGHRLRPYRGVRPQLSSRLVVEAFERDDGEVIVTAWSPDRSRRSAPIDIPSTKFSLARSYQLDGRTKAVQLNALHQFRLPVDGTAIVELEPAIRR